LAASIAAIGTLAFCLVQSADAEAAGGTAMGWGYNASGQVGIGVVSSEGCSCIASPTPLLGVADATGLAAGYEFGLALRGDGSVMSWGYNYGGELGNGNTDLDATPKPVPGVSNAIAVAAGTAHALVLLGDGTLLAWGENSFGQLGLGSATGPETCNTTQCAKRPLVVPGVRDVVAIAAGTYASYALLADGTVLAWGANGNGESGTGAASTNPCGCVPSPTAVPGINGAVAISGGAYGAAALLADGTVRAWGRNFRGELGTGSASPAVGCSCLTAVSPAGLTGVRQISQGGAHSFALLGNGLVQGWGLNNNGQVGIGSESTADCFCVPTPITLGALSDVRKVDAGEEHGAALLANGTLAEWGEGDDGQLGDGTTNQNRPTPSPVPGVTGVSDAVASDYNTFAIIGPSQKLSIALAGAGAGVVGGSGVLCSSDCSQPFAQGQVKTLRAEPAIAGQFAGWSGPCTGTGACQVRLDADATVTATFGPPKGTEITGLKLIGKRKKRKKAILRFTAPGAVTGFECLLRKPRPKNRKGAKSPTRRKPKFSPCASGRVYKNLGPGKYAFRVRALNILGADAAPAKRTFRVPAVKAKRGR
jgi:alpha-tubulin suppressor-like RCC1 family protein